MRTTLLAALAALLLVAGCGGNPKPTSLPSGSSSPSPSASPSPTPPALPGAAKAKTKAGAVAFGRHYVELINYAQATGRLDQIQGVEEAACGSCADAESYLRDLYSGGGSIRGGELRVTSIDAVRNPATHGWLVEIGVKFGPQLVDNPAPKPDQHPKGGQVPLNVQAAWRGNGWKVLEWTRGT